MNFHSPSKPRAAVSFLRSPLTYLSSGVVVVLVGLLSQIGVLQGLEFKARDWILTARGPQKPKSRIVIVEIDRDSINAPEMERPLIFWGPYHARVLQILNEAGARAVGFDFVQSLELGKYAQTDPDQLLAQQISLSPRVVLNYTRNQLPNGTSNETLPNKLLRTALALGGGQSGFANTAPDFDGTVRRFAPTDVDGMPSFALSLAAVATGQKPGIEKQKVRLGARDVPIGEGGDAVIDFVGPDGTFPRISYCDLLLHPQKYRSLIKNSVCLIGVTVYELQDFHYVPFSQLTSGKRSGLMAGVEVQANILHTLLAGKLIRQPGAPILWILLLGAALLAIPAAWLPRVSWLLPMAFVGLGLWVWLSFLAFAKWNWQLPVVAVGLCFFANHLLLSAVRFWQESQRKRWMENAMGRYVSPQVLDYLSQNPGALELGGQRREVTILFSDVRGFTPLSEGLEPEQVTLFLNSYFEKMVEIVWENGGTVDKFMGDGLMVIYGWPIAQEDHARRALQSALQMQRTVAASRADWAQMGIPNVEIGVGIHSGPAILGNIGSKRRMEQTAIGDTVNVSSRVEGLCKTLGKSLGSGILMSETSYEAAKAVSKGEFAYDIAPAGETTVRGRIAALQLFAVKLEKEAPLE